MAKKKQESVDDLIAAMFAAKAELEKAMQFGWKDELKLAFNKEPTNLEEIHQKWMVCVELDLKASAWISHVVTGEEKEKLLQAFYVTDKYLLEVDKFLKQWYTGPNLSRRKNYNG